MASVREDRRGVVLREPAPGRRSLGVLVVLLVAVFAAAAFIWNLSRRSARHAPAPMAAVETAVAPAPAAEPVAPPAPAEPVAAPAAAGAVAEPPAMSPRKQSEIARVISDGRPGLATCYQRALVRDERLDYGGLAVRLSIAASGRVDRVNISGPSKFRAALDPCLEKAVSKWTFPTAPAAYETEFPLVLQATQ